MTRARMSAPSRMALAALALAVAGGAAAPALAGPPGGVPPGLAKKGVSAKEWKRSKGHDDHYDRDRDRVVVIDRRDDYRDRNRDRVIVIGQPIPRGVDYVVIRDYDRYRLAPPPRGYSYYQADGRIWRVADATNKVAQALGAVSALLR
ncbi:MAG: RcnB family protein [Pseudomonadota bacterium]|nr:RcnB family protein [Pseudomonadota bacterium]